MQHSDTSGQTFDCPVVLNGATTFGASGTFRLPASSAVNLYMLVAHIDTTVSATARVAQVPVPYGGAGSVVQMDIVADVAIATGSLTATGAIGATAMTNGVATLANLAAAGTLASANPTALNTVATGNILKATLGGTNTGDGRCTITFTIQRA